MNAPEASNHSLYLIQLQHTSYPEGNFGENQLLDGSISLSPLYPSLTNDLHVSIATSFHQSFPWPHLLRYSSPSFGSQQTRSHSNTFPKSDVGLRCSCSECCFGLCVEASSLYTRARVWTPWSVFQDGPFDALQANTTRCV